jgi:hypothetical protein
MNYHKSNFIGFMDNRKIWEMEIYDLIHLISSFIKFEMYWRYYMGNYLQFYLLLCISLYN